MTKQRKQGYAGEEAWNEDQERGELTKDPDSAAAALEAAIRLAAARGYCLAFCTDQDLRRRWEHRRGPHTRPLGRLLVLARVVGGQRRLWLTHSVLEGRDAQRVHLAALAIRRAVLYDLAFVEEGSVLEVERRGKLSAARTIASWEEQGLIPAAGVAIIAWLWVAAVGAILRMHHRTRQHDWRPHDRRIDSLAGCILIAGLLASAACYPRTGLPSVAHHAAVVQHAASTR